MALHLAPAPVVREPREAPCPWPPCGVCGSLGPFGVCKAVALPAGPLHAVVPVVCRTCGDVRLFPADFVMDES